MLTRSAEIDLAKDDLAVQNRYLRHELPRHNHGLAEQVVQLAWLVYELEDGYEVLGREEGLPTTGPLSSRRERGRNLTRAGVARTGLP